MDKDATALASEPDSSQRSRRASKTWRNGGKLQQNVQRQIREVTESQWSDLPGLAGSEIPSLMTSLQGARIVGCAT